MEADGATQRATVAQQNFEETLPWRFWRFAFSALSSCTFNSQLSNQSEWKVGEHFAFLVLLLLFSDSPFR